MSRLSPQFITDPPEVFSMKTTSKSHLKNLVERGYALHLQLTALTEEFKAIKDQLKAEALIRPLERIPVQDDHSQGLQWIVPAKGCECRILFPSPKLKSALEADHPDLPTLRALTGNHFPGLFRQVTWIEPFARLKIREQIADRLSPMAASQVLQLLSVPSEPKALWKERPFSKTVA